MREFGIQSMAYETTCLRDQNNRRKSNKMKSNEVRKKDIEYVPHEEDEIEYSSEDDDDSTQYISCLRPRSNKVMAANVSMSSMLKKRCEARKVQEQQKKVLTPLQRQVKQLGHVPTQVESQKNVGMTIAQQEKEVISKTAKKHGQDKMLVAPGSLGAYLRLKEKSREQILRKTHEALDDSFHLRDDLFLDQLMENSEKRRASYSGVQLVDENENSESSNDDAIFIEETNKDPDDSEHDAADMINEFVPIEDHTNDQPVSKKLKRTRGPSICQDVHDRSINDRKPIILNELCQPIGPDKDTLDEFSRFLGSVARDSNLVPLNKLDWHQVPGKDLIWNYVKTKYIIPEEGKGYVLRSVGTLWRIYKSRIKKMHYKPYDNMRDIWINRPKTIPKTHFKELLKFWSLKKVQNIIERNKKNSKSQKDRHIAGPISFARKRCELEKMENMPPSEAKLYRETRKKKPGREYKTTCEEPKNMEDVQTQNHRKLLGRCTKTKRVKETSASGMLIPDEYLQPYRTSIVKETMSEVLKVLQQVLPSGMLSRVAPSFKVSSNYIVNGQSPSDINDIEQFQNDENGHKSNDDEALERNDAGNDNEVQDKDWCWSKNIVAVDNCEGVYDAHD